ncbi:hypothetical protein BRD07_03185 [Halobacteriales archaeon QS_9_68_42]|nr:MAG: hypothetical protein BRD07_03185 [Halobacteriales archaeon QS_9_68_42]
MTDTTNSDDDQEHSENDDDDVTEVTIQRDSRGWTVVETTENVVCDVGYVITLGRGRHQRITLKTEVGRPESDTDDDK